MQVVRMSTPSQAIGDLYVMREEFGYDAIPELNIALLGDVDNSRVMLSLIKILLNLGYKGKMTLFGYIDQTFEFFYGMHKVDSIEDAIKDADVIMTGRHKKLKTLAHQLDFKHLDHMRDNAIVMAPGPVTHYEMTNMIKESKHARIKEQVEAGVRTKRAILRHMRSVN